MSELDEVLGWLTGPREVDPVPAEWVPGATSKERVSLAALGSLVNGVVGEQPRPHPAFADPTLLEWLSQGEVPPEDVILATKMLVSDGAEDGLAALYANLVSGRSRRTLGTFFTPSDEVRWMINRWTEHHPAPASVADVGAGVGIFTTTAAHRWQHAQVWAIDINPITLGLLALRVHDELPLVGPEANAPGVRLVLDDFTQWMTTAWASLPGGRLILGNPPYTRLQLLPRDQRDRLWEAAGGLCGRRASLSALITAMSLRALGPEDGLCLLLPAQWLESDYARELRRHLWSLRDRRIELHLFEEDLFPDARVDAVALIIGPGADRPQNIVFSRPDHQRVFDRGGPNPDAWRELFDISDLTPSTDATLPSSRLRDVLSVRRGVATGANSFFVIPDRDRRQLDPSVLTPLIRRLNTLPDVVTDEVLGALPENERYFLLTATQQDLAHQKGLQKYVTAGQKAGVGLAHLCSSRQSWYDLTAEVRRPELVMGQSTKSTFRFVENLAGATLVNNLYGLDWKPDVSSLTRAAVLDWLRSASGQEALRSQSRSHSSGLWKIEPRALLDTPMPEALRPQEGSLL